jgi:hypothetical protein
MVSIVVGDSKPRLGLNQDVSVEDSPARQSNRDPGGAGRKLSRTLSAGGIRRCFDARQVCDLPNIVPSCKSVDADDRDRDNQAGD